MMKKMWMMLLAICFLAFVPSVETSAASVSDLTYENYGSGIMITGCSADARGALEIPSTINGKSVVAIGEEAFYGSYLTSISIPSTVTEIGVYAFYECTSITSIVIPSGVKEIGECTFMGCTKLNSVTLPNTLTTIGEKAFRQCTTSSNPMKLTLPKSITYIDNTAFEYCSYLTLQVYSGSYAESYCKSLYGTSTHSSTLGWKYSVMDACTNHTYKTTVLTKANAATKTKGTYKKECTVCGNTITGTINYPNKIQLSATSCYYNGTNRKPTVKVYDTANKLIAASYYTVTYPSSTVNAGTYTISITFKGNYAGTVKKSFVVKPVPLSSVAVGGIANTAYTGKAIIPNVKMKYGSTYLTKNKDFIYGTYNNVNVGMAKVVIKGKGNYTGSVTKYFYVLPATTKKLIMQAARGGFYCRWYTQPKQTHGYVIQVSNYSSFPSGKIRQVSTSNTSLSRAGFANMGSGKTYYARLCTYTKVKINGQYKTLYSPWSNVAKVTTY